MTEWWNALTTLEQFLYCIAIPATLILVIQFILSILGVTGDGDVDVGGDIDDVDVDVDIDADADGDLFSSDFRFVSFRTIIAFLTVFPWVAIALLDHGMGIAFSIIISILAGFVAMFLIGYLFFLATKLQSSGNISYKNAIGQSAEVYIPMHEGNNYRGKVQVLIQSRLVEADAISQDKIKMSTGETVKVVGVQGTTTLFVKPE